MRVWQKAMDVAEWTYVVSRSLPNQERYGFSAQIQRASVSIASNVAEGAGRKSDREFIRFLRIAYGSASEVETQALLLQRVGLGNPADLDTLLVHTDDVRRMLSGLIGRLLRSDRPSAPAP